MGRRRDEMVERQQVAEKLRLANKLGLTIDELEMYLVHRGEDIGNDDMFYGIYFVFDKKTPKEILDKIPGLDSSFTVYMHPWEIVDPLNYYDDEFDAIVGGDSDFKAFEEEFIHLRMLNDIKIENDKLEAIFKRQIYVAAVGTMEAFLSQTFISKVMKNDTLLKRYVETTPSFQQRKFDLSHVFSAMAGIKEVAKQELLGVIYHKLPVVREMYKITLGIEFPSLKEVIKIVNVRHDLVHRNGKTKDGDIVIIGFHQVSKAIEDIYVFCSEISKKIEELGRHYNR